MWPKETITSFFQNIVSLTHRLANINFLDDVNSLQKCDVLFICHDVDRSMVVEGRAYSPLIDSVRQDFEELGFLCNSVALPWSKLTCSKSYGHPAALNRSYLFFLFCLKISALFRFLNHFSVDNPYEVILQKTQTRLVISIGSPPYLARAARKNKVFHVELLHAFGYSKIEWGWDKLLAEDLPQGILSLDAVSSASFAPLKVKGLEIKTIPHPFLKNFLSKKRPDFLSEPNTIFNEDHTFKKVILVSLNYGYNRDQGELDQFSGILENGLFPNEVGELIDEETSILWLFRLHPVQMRDAGYEKTRMFVEDFVSKRPNCEWRLASELSYPSVACQCDGTITMISSSVYEAASLGVTSLLLCPTLQSGGVHQEWYTDLVDDGYVRKIGFKKNVIKKWLLSCTQVEPWLANLGNDSSWSVALHWMLKQSGLNPQQLVKKNTK